MDWSEEDINIPTAVFLAERDLSFRNAFGFKFPRSIMDVDTDSKDEAVTRIAEQYIEDEVANLERQQRIVRINPIFRGREFLMDEQLVFVLSPFQEPFNTIYKDHVKPTVSSIHGLSCLRADDSYDIGIRS